MILGLTVLLAASLAAPHALDLRQATPTSAVAVWLSALALRALIVLFVAMYLVLYLPETDAFVGLTRWCWHAVMPLLTTHLGLDGHRVGDTAVFLPAVVLTASLVSVTVGVARAARAVRRMLTHAALGPGPSDSLIVGGADVVVAAAGIARPRLLVSAGALTQLDDEELAAGLEHERGHIARHHSYLLVMAEICRGFARFLPGTRRVMLELSFHLERDADRWALARHHDPFALASAICKAAAGRIASGPALAPLTGSSGVTDRLDELVSRPTTPSVGGLRRLLVTTVAAVMVCVTVALASALPATAVAGVTQLAGAGPALAEPCQG